MTKHETFQNPKLTRHCDAAVYQLALDLLDHGAPLPMILDRLVTFSIAHGVRDNGPEHVATVLREIADRVEAGVMASIEAQGEVRH